MFIVTVMGGARSVLIVRSAQAVIAIHGESGTLSEISRAQAATEAVEKALELATH